MGELVQKSLEDLIPIFENLERFKLFSKAEIKLVVRKCKLFEHKLTNNDKQKIAFLTYIQYLIDFSHLIRRRRQRAKYFDNKDAIERLISVKIDTLFKIACSRFKSDVSLWMSRIQFAKTKQRYLNVGKLYFNLLQLHPNDPNLWLSAAQFELNVNCNFDSARNLLQRALRFNSKSKKLWLELFRLELLNVDKIRKRQKIIVESSDDAEASASSNDPVMQRQLALIVFKQAVKQVAEPSFCLDFVAVAKTFDSSDEIVHTIYDYLDEKFSNSEESRRVAVDRFLEREKKRLGADGNGSEYDQLHEACCEMLEKACIDLNTEKMWTMYLDFAYERYTSNAERSDDKFGAINNKFCKADQTPNCKLTEEVYLKWANLCKTEAQRQDALERAVKRYPKSPRLRLDYVKSVMAKNSDDYKVVTKAFNDALSNIPEKDSYDLWTLAIEWCLIKCPKKLEKLFQTSFLKIFEIASRMKVLYLDYVLITQNIDAVREAFKRLSISKPNGVEFYKKYVDIEMNCTNPDNNLIRSCFEHAVFEVGAESVDLWSDYYEFESETAAQNASSVYSRATRTLKSELIDEFIKRNLK